MHIGDVHHTAIIVSDYEKAKEFYVDILGGEVIEETYIEKRDGYKLDLKMGDHGQLEIFSFHNPPKRVSYPEAAGLRHLAFYTDDIEQAVAYLKSQNVPVEDIRHDEISGSRIVFFRDPDDLPLELVEPPKK